MNSSGVSSGAQDCPTHPLDTYTINVYSKYMRGAGLASDGAETMAITLTAEERRQDEIEASIEATYNAVCDKALAQAEAATDHLNAENVDESMKAKRLHVIIQQLVITQDNAARTRSEALRRLSWRNLNV